MSDEIVPEEEQNLEQAFSDAAAAAASSQAETPAAPAPTEPELSAAFRAAQSAGFDTGEFKTDEELVQAMYKRLAESQPYVDYARQVLPYDNDLRQLITSKNQPQQPAAPAEPEEEFVPEKHFKKLWGQPDYDKGWDAFVSSGMVVVDPETGHYVAQPKYANMVPVTVLQGLNGQRTWQRQALERLIANPFEETWKAFQEPMERIIQQKVSEHIKGYDSIQAVNAWEHANEHVLYEHGADGKVVYDIYGNQKPTPYGEVFIQAAREARQKFPGISHEDVIKYASAVATPYKPAPAAEAAEAAPAGKEKSFLQKAMKKASHSPNSGGYSEANDIEPVVMDGRELENLFATAAKKAGL